MDPLITTSIEGAVARLRLTRPVKRNALNHALAEQVIAALRQFADSRATVGVLSAEGPIFCAGADLVEIGQDPTDPASERVLGAFRDSPLMWIAVIEHPALGAGLSLAMSCPVVIAQDDTWFSLPEHRMGLFPAAVVADLEPHIGTRRALTMALTGQRMSAGSAAAVGLVTELATSGAIAARVEAWTAMLGQRAGVLESARNYWRDRYETDHYRQRIETLQRQMQQQYD